MRRAILWLAVALLTLGVAAGWGWFVWLPGYRPAVESGERYGVDVSHHQGPIDWNAVAADDVSFAYIKATEGGDFSDPRFEENWTGAADAGIVRGAYHFFTLCTPGVLQARHFLATVPRDPAALPPAVDLELAGNCPARPEPGIVRRELERYLEIVESATGRTAVMYVGDDFEGLYPVKEDLDRPLWLLRFLRRPGGDWVIWQVMGYARVDGIEGPVDLDVFRPGIAG